MILYHGSATEITELENLVMFFASEKQDSIEFAHAMSDDGSGFLYKLELPETAIIDEVNDFGLFDCAFSNRDSIENDGWVCNDNCDNWVAIKDPSKFQQYFTLIEKW